MMILYNYRCRGPYEYDKFVNNTLQFFNETKMMEDRLLNKQYSQLQNDIKQLNEILDTLTGENCNLQQQLLILNKAGV